MAEKEKIKKKEKVYPQVKVLFRCIDCNWKDY